MLAAGEASLQDAWLREVQRRATQRGARANFVPYTNSLELPQAISDDLASFIEESAATAGGGGLPPLAVYAQQVETYSPRSFPLPASCGGN